MPQITARGRKLAAKLAPAYDGCQPAPGRFVEICSLIARHAATHQRLAEEECNGPPGVDRMTSAQIERWQAGLERRTEACEACIKRLVAALPPTNAGAIVPRLGGDPRGCTVKLTLPGEFATLHDDWGREGVCVE